MLPYSAEVNLFRDFPDSSSAPDLHAGDLIYVKAQLTNRGDQPWFGVHSALIGGETRVWAQWVGQEKLGSEHQLLYWLIGWPRGNQRRRSGWLPCLRSRVLTN